MDEIFDERKSEYIYKYSDLLDSYINFVKESNSIGNEILGQDLIDKNDLTDERKKTMQMIIEHLALSSFYILNIKNLINVNTNGYPPSI